MKIGMYNENEIYEYMTEQEGSMLGRSMYDAISNKIHALITENEQQKKDIAKYKSLYQNEKDHTDTLKRIIKKIEEELKKHLTARDYSNHKYELFGREYLEELYDLLKEIK